MAIPTASINPPSPEPIKIEYRRWKNKKRGYVVEVEGVHHSQGKYGWYATVKVREKGKEKVVTWPGRTFLRTFEPIGRKLRIPSSWERL